MYSCVPMSKLNLTLLKTLLQILLWSQPTFLSMRGFHSCSFYWMQRITDMSRGELCWDPLSPIKTFQNMIERLVDAAQSLMLNPCHGWDELNKILCGFEYWDLLKTFQAYGFYPFWLFHTLTDLPKPLKPSLSIAGKAGQNHVSCVPWSFSSFFLHFTTCFPPFAHSVCRCAMCLNWWLCLMSGVNHNSVYVTAFISRPCQNSQPVCTCCR